MDRQRWARMTIQRGLAAIAPGPSAWRGAALGLALLITFLLVIGGLAFVSGRGTVADALTAVVLGWLLILLLARLHLVWIPARWLAVGVAATLVITLLFTLSAGPFTPIIPLLLLASAALVGAGVASLVSRRQQRRLHNWIAATGLLLGAAVLVVVGAWLLPEFATADSGGPPPEGALTVHTLTYGGGVDARRAEFGNAADVRTPTVDGTAFLENWSGLRGWLRSQYWGFGPDRLPLNATVWYPEGEGPFPLVLIVHGNARMELPSDRGYAWLGEDLASRGYVVASIDQNFLNASVTRGLDLGREVDARAWLLLEHLRLWHQWQTDPESPLHGLADLERVALIGHSRGGEAVATAAYFNKLERYPEDAMVTFDVDFAIRAVVALAPADRQYQPAGRPTPLRDTSYLVLHGGLDGDVFSFMGLGQFQRTTFSGEAFGLRAAVFLPDANHGQFNTQWGRRDLPGLAATVLDTRPIMEPELQRLAARRAVVAFLDGTLRDDLDGLKVLRSPLDPAWPAGSRVITRYADSTEVTLAGFDEDADPATGTLAGVRIAGEGLAIWREEPAAMRLGEQGSNVAVLGWSRRQGEQEPRFALRLPEDVPLPRNPVLTLALADSGESPPGGQREEGPIDLTVELVDANGGIARMTLGEFGGIPPAQPSRRFKSPLPEWSRSIEPVAQTFRVELIEFAGDGFDPAQLREIRLVFDRTPSGVVLLDAVGIATGTVAAP